MEILRQFSAISIYIGHCFLRMGMLDAVHSVTLPRISLFISLRFVIYWQRKVQFFSKYGTGIFQNVLIDSEILMPYCQKLFVLLIWSISIVLCILSMQPILTSVVLHTQLYVTNYGWHLYTLRHMHISSHVSHFDVQSVSCSFIMLVIALSVVLDFI